MKVSCKFVSLYSFNVLRSKYVYTQLTLTCLKSTPLSSVSIVDFEQENISWVEVLVIAVFLYCAP